MGNIVVLALLSTLFVMLVLWYVRYHSRRRRLYELAAQFDGPKPWPLIGNALQCLVPLTDITQKMIDVSTKYKSPARIWFGPFLTIALWDPESIKIVVNQALTKEAYLYGLIETISGRGLVTAPVEEWKRHKKLIAPIFNQKFLDGFAGIFRKHSSQLVENLKDQVDKGVFNASKYVQSYSMNSLTETLMDFSDENDTVRNGSILMDYIFSMFQAIELRVTKLLYVSNFVFNMSSAGRELSKAKKSYGVFINSVIEKWQEDYQRQTMKTKGKVRNADSYKPKKLIEHLLSIYNGSGKLTLEELKGEVNTIMVAGLETTYVTFGFTLIALGMHPDIQEKLYNEVHQALGDKKQLEHDDIKDLDYLDRVIKETLRILPSTIGIARYTEHDIKLENHTIPANTTILIGLAAIHKDPNIWPNPTKFDPDRFLPEEEAKRHPYSFIPFSAGPRSCVGMRFALMSIKTAVSTFLLHYKVGTSYKSIDEVKLTMKLVCEATHGCNISITRR